MHITLKAGQRLDAGPTCLRQFLAPLLHCCYGLFWPPFLQTVQHRLNSLSVVTSLSEQDHYAQTVHLLLIVETIAVALIALRTQKALLLPEVQGRDAHTHLPCRLSHMQALRMARTLRGHRLGRQCMQGREQLLTLLPFVGKLGVTRVDRGKRKCKVACMKRAHNHRHTRPTIASDQTARGLERGEVLLRVETISTLTACSPWQQAQSFVVAYLLHADPHSLSQVNRAQRGVKCHVKPSITL